MTLLQFLHDRHRSELFQSDWPNRFIIFFLEKTYLPLFSGNFGNSLLTLDSSYFFFSVVSITQFGKTNRHESPEQHQQSVVVFITPLEHRGDKAIDWMGMSSFFFFLMLLRLFLKIQLVTYLNRNDSLVSGSIHSTRQFTASDRLK